MCEYCSECGEELKTVTEIEAGMCETCYLGYMDTLASNIIFEPSMYPNLDDF